MSDTTTAPVSHADRKAAHDALQEHISGIQDRYAAVAQRGGALGAQARLMHGYMGSVASKAKAAYRAGGNPSIDSHVAVLSSAGQHLAKMDKATQPVSSNPGNTNQQGDSPESADDDSKGWNG
jgi:hypothetical protein